MRHNVTCVIMAKKSWEYRLYVEISKVLKNISVETVKTVPFRSIRLNERQNSDSNSDNVAHKRR